MAHDEWRATVEEKYRFAHAFYMELVYNGFIASTLRHHGQDAVGELHWRVLRQHQRDFFLPGLKKLGLENEATDAIKAAKFHVLANGLGGVDMRYVEETPEKAWIIYLTSAPNGSLLGALEPQAFFRGMQAWHAHNGLSLGNRRMAFVITHLVCWGDAYDAGYFKIFDRELSHPEETLQFSLGEKLPPMDSARQPELSADWTPERRVKALRNFAVEFGNEMIHGMLEIYGIGGTRALVEHAAAVNMVLQKRNVIEGLGLKAFDAAGIATFIQRDRALLDEEVAIEKHSAGEYVVRQTDRNPRLFPDPGAMPVEIDEALLKGWRILVELTNPDLRVDMTAALTDGDPHYEWRIYPRRG